MEEDLREELVVFLVVVSMPQPRVVVGVDQDGSLALVLEVAEVLEVVVEHFVTTDRDCHRDL
jgi:hypothetical protein